MKFVLYLNQLDQLKQFVKKNKVKFREIQQITPHWGTLGERPRKCAGDQYLPAGIWGQNLYKINRLFILQRKALRFVYLIECNVYTNPPFSKSKIIKLSNKLELKIVFF